MVHISAIIKQINWFADDLETMGLQIRELREGVEALGIKYIPHFERERNIREDIENGIQTRLGDFK